MRNVKGKKAGIIFVCLFVSLHAKRRQQRTAEGPGVGKKMKERQIDRRERGDRGGGSPPLFGFTGSFTTSQTVSVSGHFHKGPVRQVGWRLGHGLGGFG